MSLPIRDIILDTVLGLLVLAFIVGVVLFLAWGTGRLTF